MVTSLLKNREIVKEIFFPSNVTKETTFPSRNGSWSMNLTMAWETMRRWNEISDWVIPWDFWVSLQLSSRLKNQQFINLEKYYNANQLWLLLRKGLYPHDHVNYMKRIKEYIIYIIYYIYYYIIIYIIYYILLYIYIYILLYIYNIYIYYIYIYNI